MDIKLTKMICKSLICNKIAVDCEFELNFMKINQQVQFLEIQMRI